MGYIATTFAHGNGPYSRCMEWAIAVNDVREEKGLKRLPILIPLVYPGRQERIMKEEIQTNMPQDFLKEHPQEILLDKKYGELLAELMFKSADYEENLNLLANQYSGIEDSVRKHLDGLRIVSTLDSKESELDLRDAEFQLGLNNRIQTGLPNQFYTAGGAGPFDEILERAIKDKEIKFSRESMRKALPIAKRMIENQKIIFSNDPGVFSYDSNRELRGNETLTPPFIHTPKPDTTELPGNGIYLLMTGIDGIRESKMYNAVMDLGMKLFAPAFSIKSLPEAIRKSVVELAPSKINNPYIIAQYARAGWSSAWLSHLAEKGFLTPPYDPKDDPEMLFNERGIRKLKLGAIVENNARGSLEEAIVLAQGTKDYNDRLLQKYGTLDGIRYAAEAVVDSFEK